MKIYFTIILIITINYYSAQNLEKPLKKQPAFSSCGERDSHELFCTTYDDPTCKEVCFEANKRGGKDRVLIKVEIDSKTFCRCPHPRMNFAKKLIEIINKVKSFLTTADDQKFTNCEVDNYHATFCYKESDDYCKNLCTEAAKQPEEGFVVQHIDYASSAFCKCPTPSQQQGAKQNTLCKEKGNHVFYCSKAPTTFCVDTCTNARKHAKPSEQLNRVDFSTTDYCRC